VPDAVDLGRRLAAYLGAGVAHIHVLASGWETTVFDFALAHPSLRLTSSVGESLVLRLYDAPGADAKGTREARTMSLLSGIGYPVPKPLLFESDRAPLGAPFLIMERAAGGPLFVTGSFPRALKTFSLGFIGFVRAQARLHRLDPMSVDPRAIGPAYFVERSRNDASLLDRLLDVVAERIERGPLPGLREAHLRLCERAERFRLAPAAIVHLDYHPQNVVVNGTRVTGVIDWVSADRGDRHLCAATTSVILATSAMDRPRWMRDNAAGNTLRALFNALYLPLYHSLAPMEWARLRYCQAVASLLRLSTFGMMGVRGPAAVGYRPEAITNVTTGVVRLLSRYTGRKAGTALTLGPIM
jgi:aminoglycoside phosphotransferase (APT) family kinase protein